MWMSEHDRRVITEAVAASFRSFGGGKTSEFNPLVNALKDQPAQFAASVDIRDVVDFIVNTITIDISTDQ